MRQIEEIQMSMYPNATIYYERNDEAVACVSDEEYGAVDDADRPSIASIQYSCGDFFMSELSDYDRARSSCAQALHNYTVLHEKKEFQYIPQKAALLNNLADVCLCLCEYDTALEYYKESLSIRTSLARGNPSYKPHQVTTMLNIAVCCTLRYEFDKAKRSLQRIFAIYDKTVEANRWMIEEYVGAAERLLDYISKKVA